VPGCLTCALTLVRGGRDAWSDWRGGTQSKLWARRAWPVWSSGPSTSPLAAMRKVSAIAIAIGSLIVGSFVGYIVSHRIFQASLSAYQWTSIDTMSRYVMAERFKGTPAAYEAALHEFLQSLDAWERKGADSGVTSPRALAVDRALTYARLALLAAKRNDSGAAAKYWSQALAMCPQIGWTSSCSVEAFTDAVHGLDESSLWNPKRRAVSVPEHGS
jgi:hypothetical protein